MIYGEEKLKKNLVLFTFLAAVSILLLFLDNRGWLGFKSVLQAPFLALEKPLYSARLSVTGFWGFVYGWPARELEMEQLRAQLAKVNVDQKTLNECLAENNHIKKLLGASLPARWQFLEAKVIGADGKLHLDRGTKDGVTAGMNVVYEKILIGRVEIANSDDAVVELINQKDLIIPVKVNDAKTTRARGLLTGQGDNRLLLDKVLQEERISKDDWVVTSGEEGWLPDLLIGRIDEIEEDKAALYQRATVLPLTDLKRLEMVFVVIKD